MPHRRLAAALPLLFLLAAAPAAAGLGRWTAAGPFGGAVEGLAVAADAAGTVYAETHKGAFRSTDAGRTWLRLPLPGESWALTVHPRRPRTVFAANLSAGLWRSDDGGARFRLLARGSGVLRVIVPPAGDTLYAAAGGRPLRSRDGGATWEEIPGAPLNLIGLFFTRDPRLIYGTGGNLVYRSRDGGSTWELRSGLPGLRGLLVDPRRPSVLYALTSQLLKSTDGGRTWTPIPAPGEGSLGALTLDSSAPGTFYAVVTRRSGAGEVGEIFRSRDGGASWRRLRMTEPVFDLAVDPLRPARVYAGLRNGVLRTADFGASWQFSVHGLRATYVEDVAVDRWTPGRLLAGAHTGYRSLSLLESLDRGTTWRYHSEALRRRMQHVTEIAFDPNVPDAVYLASQGGVFASADGGVTWRAANEGLQGYAVELLAVHPAQPGLLYASAFTHQPCGLTLCRVYGFFRRESGAAAWTRFEPPPARSGYYAPLELVRALAFDVGSPDTVHALARGELFTSLDGGATWGRSENPPGAPVDIEGDPDAPGVLYALRASANEPVLFESRDEGRTFTPLGDRPPGAGLPRSLAVSSGAQRTFFVGMHFSGVFASDDRGASWELLGGAAPPSPLRDVLLDPSQPRDIYAVTEVRGGLFVLTRP